MNSAAMEYNLSRHPELYYMDVFGVIRLNEEEYKKQTEMNTMSEMSILMQTRTEADIDASKEESKPFSLELEKL